jgi:transketolase
MLSRQRCPLSTENVPHQDCKGGYIFQIQRAPDIILTSGSEVHLALPAGDTGESGKK